MDKKTKQLIVVIIVLVISAVCAALGVSLGVPFEALVPIGTEIIDGFTSAEQPEEVAQEAQSQNNILPYTWARLPLN